MAVPLILAAQVGRSLLVAGTKHAVKKYGDDVVKQVQKSPEFKKLKARDIESKKILAKKSVNNKRFKSQNNQVQENPVLRKKAEERVLDLDTLPIEEIPLKFSKGGLLSEDMYRENMMYGGTAKKRMGYEEGGSLLDDDMPVDIPMDMPMEEQEVSMMPEEMPEMNSDSDMEENYTRFIMDEALSEEEEDMLVSKLEQDNELSMLFDKVIETAQEFAGNGPVEGPGTGVSDSIPARLSDGEFVFTAKAVEEIGEDTLMSMMNEAEAAVDERQNFNIGGMLLGKENQQQDQYGKTVDSNLAEDDIRKGMLSVNPRLNQR